MSNNLSRFKPLNRHLSIVPHFRKSEAENSGVLLPEDFSQENQQHLIATVLEISSDCSPPFQRLRATCEVQQVVVDASMIKKVETKKKTHYLILENYVLGFLGSTDAD